MNPVAVQAQCVWKELCHKYIKSLESPWLCWLQLRLISCWHLHWLAVAYSGFPTSLILAGPPPMPSYFCCLRRDQESSAMSETLGLLPRSGWPMQRVPAPFKCRQSAPTSLSVHYGLLHLALCQPLAPVCCIVYIQGTFLPFPVFSRGAITPLSPLPRWMKTPLEKCHPYSFWLLCRHAHQVTQPTFLPCLLRDLWQYGAFIANRIWSCPSNTSEWPPWGKIRRLKPEVVRQTCPGWLSYDVAAKILYILKGSSHYNLVKSGHLWSQ